MFNKLKDRTNSETIQLELKIKDTSLHKSRVENRKSDIDELKIPSWNDVIEREYEELDKELDGKNHEIWTDDMENVFNLCLKLSLKINVHQLQTFTVSGHFETIVESK